MRHRSDGRGYICIVNSLLLLSVHTTCHRRCQAKEQSLLWFGVLSTALEQQTASPFHYDSSSLQDVMHMIRTQCAAPTSCLGHTVYTQSVSWSEAFQNASVTLMSFPQTHKRTGPHCSHKSETFCVLHLRLCRLKLTHCLEADAMTLSCDLKLVTALVTRDWWLYNIH